MNADARTFPGARGLTACCCLALVAVALLSGCRSGEAPMAEDVRPVRAVAVEQRAAGGDSVAITGSIQAEAEFNLAFRIDGRIIDRLVNVGDAVKQGQLIATLSPENEQSNVTAAQANLSAARGQLTEARNSLARNRELQAQNFISQAALDQFEQVARTAQANVDATTAALDVARNRLSYTRLLAETAGIVTAEGAEAGEVVQAGRMVVRIARQSGRDAVFDVPAQMKDMAPTNPDISVSLVTDPRITAQGRVREVSPQADPVTGSFRIRVGLSNPPPQMRLGTTVVGRMKISDKPSIQLPASALTRFDGKPAVWVVDPKSSTVASRSVEISRFDDSTMAVSGGLKAGELVVTAGVQALRPGQKVRLLGPKS
jgi:membrane fusion protein, multidrug efflux system